jgi:DNA mismatch repair protein MutS2
MDSDEATVMLRKLEESLADAASHERHRREELDKVRALREELQKKQSKVEKDRQEILERTRLEARTDLEKLRKQVRRTEEELRDLNQAAQITMARVQQVIDRESKEKVASDLAQLNERVRLAQKERERLEKEMDGQFVYQAPVRTRVYEPHEIPAGSFVTVEDFSTPAEVITVDAKRGSLLISVASMEMTIPIDRVIGVYRERPGAGSIKDRSRVSYHVESVNVPFELDVHGMTVDEALPKVHGYIDDAAKSGIDKVTIVHGRGRGILRDVIRRELASHPTIRSFESGGYHDGGDGVTIAYLKGQ